MKGSYILLIKLDKDKEIKVGKVGKIKFKIGHYFYVGSALHSLVGRINRHIRKRKKSHWHIDYLLKEAKIIDVFYKESIQREECRIAKILSEKLRYINDFGCSDCKCHSHLFYGEIDHIDYIIEIIKMKKYSKNANI